MINHSNPISLTRSKGITLVEILLVIALLVIVLSFAIPTMGSATAKADMMAAVENVEYSIKTARNTARMNETEISVDITMQAGETAQVIEVTQGRNGGAAGIPDYRLPEDIELVADQPVFEFDPRGLVRNPGTITLVSRVDETVTATVNVK